MHSQHNFVLHRHPIKIENWIVILKNGYNLSLYSKMMDIYWMIMYKYFHRQCTSIKLILYSSNINITKKKLTK